MPEAFDCAENGRISRAAWIGFIRTLREFELPAIFSGASSIVWCVERDRLTWRKKSRIGKV